MARSITKASAKTLSRAVPHPAGPHAADEIRKRPGRDPIEVIWSLFCSVRFAVVLNLALALASMIGTVVPQMQPGIQSFDVELSQFLSGAKGRYGDFSGLLYWAGFYDLYNSLWFRLLVVTVVFSIVMCTLNRWQPIMRLVRNPAVRASDSFITGLTEKAHFRGVPTDMQGAEAALRSALRKSRYRLLTDVAADGATIFIYADRDRWSKLVTFVSHAALVLLILTAAGLAQAGWREQSVPFYPGKAVNVGHGTDFTVRNNNFWIDYYPDGTTIKEYKENLSVIEGGQEVLTRTITVNEPLRYKGVSFYLVSYQPVLYATVTDSIGTQLPLRRIGASGLITDTTSTAQALLDFQFTSSDNLPMDLVQLPLKDHTLTLQLTYYQDVTRAAKENPPVYLLGYLDENFDKPIYDAFIPKVGPLQLPGYEQYNFTFTKDTAAVMEIAKDPGLEVVGLWFVIMTAGFTISLYTTFTRCWAKITLDEENPGAVNVVVGGLAEKNKVSFERDFEKTAIRIRDALGKAVVAGGATSTSNVHNEVEAAT